MEGKSGSYNESLLCYFPYLLYIILHNKKLSCQKTKFKRNEICLLKDGKQSSTLSKALYKLNHACLSNLSHLMYCYNKPSTLVNYEQYTSRIQEKFTSTFTNFRKERL